MFFDNQLVFSAAQSLVTTTSVASTNVINLTNARDLGIGPGMAIPQIDVIAGTAFTTANGATLNIQFQGSTDSVTWTTYEESGPLAAAVLTANTSLWKFDWPHRAVAAAMPLYVRLNYALPATTAFTAGTITLAAVTLALDTNPSGQYPSGFTVA